MRGGLRVNVGFGYVYYGSRHFGVMRKVSLHYNVLSGPSLHPAFLKPSCLVIPVIDTLSTALLMPPSRALTSYR